MAIFSELDVESRKEIIVYIYLNYKFFSSLFVTLSLSISLNINANDLITNLRIEEGFVIEIFVDDIDTPRQIAESDEGIIFDVS